MRNLRRPELSILWCTKEIVWGQEIEEVPQMGLSTFLLHGSLGDCEVRVVSRQVKPGLTCETPLPLTCRLHRWYMDK
jgi:hypothetical protein